MNLITVKDFSLITGLCISSLRTFLEGYRFDKFRYGKKYDYNKEFIKTFINFLHLKRMHKLSDELEKKLLSGK